MTNTIARQFEAAQVFIQHQAHKRALDAKTEIKAMGQFARRSLGQKVRWATRGLVVPAPDEEVMPATTRRIA